MSEMRTKITVVIPFYQQKEGILIKAVRSALKQTGMQDLEIIVVDDASPVAARKELESIIESHRREVKIIEQPNGGPAAARNKGLDHVSPDTQYVAFLDSDDEWAEDHLSNALAALEHGYDFYFSDFYQLNQSVSAFNRAKRINVVEHRNILGTSHLHQYQDDMQDQVLRGNIIGTPTVVYRYPKFSKLRFREEFVYAGEDYLFWLDLSSLTKKIAFSSRCECTCGAGINIFSGSGWGTEKSLIRIHHEMKYKKAISKLFSLTQEQTVSNNTAIALLRKSFVADVLHRLAHKRSMDKSVLFKQFKIDPQSFFYFIPLAMLLAIRR
jgi:succinoglycan biosynthesis protein ExoW